MDTQLHCCLLKGLVSNRKTVGNRVVRFPAVWCAEAALKLAGFGVRNYFGMSWNRFDFTLVLAAYVGYFTALPSFSTVLRVFRVMRVVRLVRGSKAMFQVLGDRNHSRVVDADVVTRCCVESLSRGTTEEPISWCRALARS